MFLISFLNLLLEFLKILNLIYIVTILLNARLLYDCAIQAKWTVNQDPLLGLDGKYNGWI